MTEESKVMPNTATGPAYEWERGFTVRTRDEVAGFIQRHPFLAPLLAEAYRKIQNYFPSAPVFLEVMADPEVDGHEDLVASISTDLPPAAAHEKLKEFRRDWWLASLHLAQRKLCIKLEFR